MTAIANILSNRVAVVIGLTVTLWAALIAVVSVLSFIIAKVFATEQNALTFTGAIFALAVAYFIGLKTVAVRR